MKKTLHLCGYACLVLGLLSTITFASEQLKNPQFAQGLKNWSMHIHPSLKAKRQTANGILTIQPIKPGKPQDVQLIQAITLENDQQYKFSFDAKQEGKPVTTQITCMQQGKPFSLSQSIQITKDWTRHEWNFTPHGIVVGRSPTLRLFLGNQTLVQLRNFSLTKSSDPQSPIKASAQDKTVTKVSASTSIRIIPEPKQLTLKPGTFKLGKTLFIQSNNPKSAELFEREVTFITGKQKDDFQITQHRQTKLFLGIANTADVDLFDQIKAAPRHQGGYALSILPEGIAIKGHDEEGLRNGIQSMLQVLEQSDNQTLPQMVIRDLPDLKFRAMHLVLRAPGAWGKKNPQEVQDVYRWLFRRLGRYKYTHVCLMIKGNLKLKKHPEVWPKAAYTHQDIKAFIKIGEEQGLTVFPEIKTLGKFFFGQSKKTRQAHQDMINRKIASHSGGSWKSIFHEGWSKNRLTAEQKQVKVKNNGALGIGLDVASPKVVPLMLDCIDEIYELFNQPKLFSLGMDEAHFFGSAWPKDVNRGKMLADYANALNRHLREKGCRSMIWGDMLLSHLQFPYYFENHGGPPKNTFEALPLLDKDIILADWHYGYEVAGVTPEHYPSISWFRQNGFDVVAVPWFKPYNMANLARDIAATEGLGIMGSSWALHSTFALHTRENAFAKKPNARKSVEARRELGIFSSTAEASWNILKSKENMKKYDSVQWEKRWLPVNK